MSLPNHFDLIATDGAARTGRLTTPHGVVRTPAFMPVGTAGAMKGMHWREARDAGADIVLGNTYHLMLRPGAERVAALGGLQRFTGWNGPMLTDSGGFQVMSLSELRKVTENAVTFRSHIDGTKIELSPETTEGRQGFVHPVRMEGIAEKATLEFIIRDFKTAALKDYENMLQEKLKETLLKYPGGKGDLVIKEQYRNMKEVLDKYPEVSAYAEEAIQRAGIVLHKMSARGGTDGSRLSFMGLPCPNLFTGEMAFHGKHEYVSLQDMQKSVETIVHLAMIWEERS